MLFPIIYRKVSFIIFCYLAAKSISFVFVDLRILVENCRILRRVESSDKKYLPLGQVTQEIYHAFIIPSYKEDI